MLMLWFWQTLCIYINLRAAVDWVRTVAEDDQRGTVVVRNGCAFLGGGSVAGRPDSTTV